MQCAGGCGELEEYCYCEHQVQHWKSGHKRFCKQGLQTVGDESK